MQDTNDLFETQDFVLSEADEQASLFADDVSQEPKEKEAEEPAKLALDEPEVKPEELTPAQKAEYLAIFDTLMFEGAYQERVQIGTRYHAVFRTRSAEEDLTISSRLDARNFQTILAYQNQSSLLTLAYSLVEWNGEDFRAVEPKDRYKIVAGLPSQAVVVLSDALGKFDAKVMQAVTYGQENF